MLLAEVQLCTGGTLQCGFLLEFVYYLQSLESGSTGNRVSLPSSVSLCSWKGARVVAWGTQGGGGVSIFGDTPLHRYSPA